MLVDNAATVACDAGSDGIEGPLVGPSVPITNNATISAGAVLKRFSYDGLGRLVKTESFNPDDARRKQVERHIYDGVRRVQELVTEFEDRGDGWTGSTILAREYVWGPGDSFAGVDELVAQYGGDESGQASVHARSQPWFVLQDAGGDVVALVNQEPNSPATVAAQYTYDAYGQVHTAEHLLVRAWVGRGKESVRIQLRKK